VGVDVFDAAVYVVVGIVDGTVTMEGHTFAEGALLFGTSVDNVVDIDVLGIVADTVVLLVVDKPVVVDIHFHMTKMMVATSSLMVVVLFHC
jgi:hypothetical protein